MRRILRTPWGITLLIASIVVFIIIFHRLGALGPLEDGLSIAAKPVQLFFTTTANRVSGVFGYFRNIKDLQKENEELKTKADELTVENLMLKKATDDSKLIQEAMRYITDYELNSVTARVISHSVSENLELIIVNKGANEKIDVGYPVISGNGILIGKVVEVTDQIAKILLITDNHSEISAVIQDANPVPGIVSGQYGLAMSMELIPHDRLVKIGDLVVTSGLEEFVPSDLLIGTIKSVNKVEGELFQSAVVEPTINLKTVTIVSIIIPFDV